MDNGTSFVSEEFETSSGVDYAGDSLVWKNFR